MKRSILILTFIIMMMICSIIPGISMASEGQVTNGSPTALIIDKSNVPCVGAVNAPYSHTLTATGNAPITWLIESGSLPDGLILSGAGVLSGNPTKVQTANFTVKASDGAGQTDTAAFSITIDAKATVSISPPLTINASNDNEVPIFLVSNIPGFYVNNFSYFMMDGVKISAGLDTYVYWHYQDINSIIIKLQPKYLKALSLGKHTVTIGLRLAPYEGMILSTTITILEAPSVKCSPSSVITMGKADVMNITIGSELARFNSNNFSYLLMDGNKVLPGTNTYTVHDGSIVIRMNPLYLNTLSAGKHIVTIGLRGDYYKNNSVSTTITVTDGTAVTPPPSTGDHTPIGLLVIALLCAMCGLGIAVSIHMRKRHS
ncbi:MAG: Ig domain-containing protein [Clostridia bacterium]